MLGNQPELAKQWQEMQSAFMKQWMDMAQNSMKQNNTMGSGSMDMWKQFAERTEKAGITRMRSRTSVPNQLRPAKPTWTCTRCSPQWENIPGHERMVW